MVQVNAASGKQKTILPSDGAQTQPQWRINNFGYNWAPLIEHHWLEYFLRTVKTNPCLPISLLNQMCQTGITTQMECMVLKSILSSLTTQFLLQYLVWCNANIGRYWSGHRSRTAYRPVAEHLFCNAGSNSYPPPPVTTPLSGIMYHPF